MILFVHGPDTYRVAEKRQELIQQFRQKRDAVGLNVVSLLGDALSFERIRQETMMQGFLAEKKMIVVYDLLAQGGEEMHQHMLDFIPTFVAQQDAGNVLLFVEGKVSGKAKAVSKKLFGLLKEQEYVFEFDTLQGAALVSWIQTYVTSRGGTIDAHTARTLAERSTGNLWRLTNDIDKLIGLRNGEPITHEDVLAHTMATFEDTIFSLTDAIAQKDSTRALGLLTDTMNNGAHALYLLTMIVRQFRILLLLKSEVEQGNQDKKKLSAALNIHPYVVQKTLPLVRTYSLDALKRMYRRLLTVDERLKTSHPNPELLLDLLIVRQ